MKVEELSLKSQLRDRDIKLATSSMACATPSAVEQAAETSRLLAATSVTVDVEQKVNLIDLDLEVPINTTGEWHADVRSLRSEMSPRSGFPWKRPVSIGLDQKSNDVTWVRRPSEKSHSDGSFFEWINVALDKDPEPYLSFNTENWVSLKSIGFICSDCQVKLSLCVALSSSEAEAGSLLWIHRIITEYCWIIAAVLVPNEVGSSDEEFDEEECLLKLWWNSTVLRRRRPERSRNVFMVNFLFLNAISAIRVWYRETDKQKMCEKKYNGEPQEIFVSSSNSFQVRVSCFQVLGEGRVSRDEVVSPSISESGENVLQSDLVVLLQLGRDGTQLLGQPRPPASEGLGSALARGTDEKKFTGLTFGSLLQPHRCRRPASRPCSTLSSAAEPPWRRVRDRWMEHSSQGSLQRASQERRAFNCRRFGGSCSSTVLDLRIKV